MLDLNSFRAALKVHYTSDAIKNAVYEDNPFLALVPKYTKFGGKNLPIPILTGNPQGRSSSFAKALANKSSSKVKEFVLTRVKDYAIATIDNETALASMGNANAFMEAVGTEIDGAIQSIKNSLAQAIVSDGTGVIGQRASISTNTVTLADPETVVHFEEGMTIGASATRGGGTVRVGVAKIVAVDRSTGTITLDNAALIASFANNDYLFVEGDYDAKIKGLAAWLPMSASVSSTAFFGVDRSVDKTRLAGIYFDGRSLPITEALQKTASLIAREGGAPDLCFTNFSNYCDVEIALGTKVQYLELKVGEIGFQALKINGPRGLIKVIADRNMQSDRAYLLTSKYWKLYSLGECPQILDLDGNKLLREAGEDASTVRIGYYAQLGCQLPGANGVCQLK